MLASRRAIRKTMLRRTLLHVTVEQRRNRLAHVARVAGIVYGNVCADAAQRLGKETLAVIRRDDDAHGHRLKGGSRSNRCN